MIERQIQPLEPDMPWKRAVLAFFDAGYTWGSLVPTDWFYAALGAERSSVFFINQFDKMKMHLLEHHKMDLRATYRGSYEIVLPEKQTPCAMNGFESDIRKLACKTKKRLANVDYLALSDKQRTENQESIAKLGFFSRQTRKAIL